MRVVIGADHAGFLLKQLLISHLEEEGHLVLDVGTDSEEPVDYPDIAAAVGRAVVSGEGERAESLCAAQAQALPSPRTRSQASDLPSFTTITRHIRLLSTMT